MDYNNVAQEMVDFLQENGAKNIELYSTQDKCNYAKKIIVATGKDAISSRKLALIFKDEFRKNYECFHTDGLYKAEWIVLDFKDIIIHIFTKETRQKFNIDKMWQTGGILQ